MSAVLSQKEIGKSIMELRKAKGLFQDELARDLGIPRSSLVQVKPRQLARFFPHFLIIFEIFTGGFMKQKKKLEETKDNNRPSGEEKRRTRSAGDKFNTGSHTPSSLRNVGPGYDDTGKGDYAKAKDAENNPKPGKKRSTKEMNH